MRQLHGGGRMEKKHNMCDVHVCGSIAMRSTEMNCQEIRLSFDDIRFAMRQTCVCEIVKDMR